MDVENGLSSSGATSKDSYADGKSSPFLTNIARSRIISILIIVAGAMTSVLILGLGIPKARNDQEQLFLRTAADVLYQLDEVFRKYVVVAAWAHQATQHDTTRDGFLEMYEYVVAQDISFYGVGYLPNVTDSERSSYENETAMFLKENYPNVPYCGFTAATIVNPTTAAIDRSPPKPFYFPAHFIEPLPTNGSLLFLDFDFYSVALYRTAISAALDSREPVLTERFPFTEMVTSERAWGVALIHPGVPLPSKQDHMSFVSVTFLQLVSLVANQISLSGRISVYIYDSNHMENKGNPVDNMTFLAAVDLLPHRELHYYDNEVSFNEAMNSQSARYSSFYNLTIANRQWVVLVTADDSSFQPNMSFIILGSAVIFVASLCLALWLYTDARHAVRVNELKATAEAEKNAIKLENARSATKRERELNDFVAHEVRNPLSAAMSACTFVAAEVNEAEPLVSKESQDSVRDDVHIIGNSLQFINDLLRNMLDMHRADSNQLKIEMGPTDVLRDVLEPVASMLYNRGSEYEIPVECRENLLVMTDRLRLKQIVLNLGRNASKFVERGFVRLRGEEVDGVVKLYVEDSGPGIPEEKRKMLFHKFQESLDSLNQGTGIGLSVCRDLIDLMKGDISLDESYQSGVEGCPGSRFIINLNKRSLDLDTLHAAGYDGLASIDKGSTTVSSSQNGDVASQSLPDALSVLFVDDDMVLRKMFTRSVRRIRPEWKLHEASSGETALRLVEENSFDLIFIDQYMASVDKQLLGTETVRALRGKGVTSRICGLSANDMEKVFLQAGANAFMMKPFPCEAEQLSGELVRCLDVAASLDAVASSLDAVAWMNSV